jgi:hypothetical protein
MDSDQKNSPAVGTAEARLEKMDERHVNFTECNGFNFHFSNVSKFQRFKDSQSIHVSVTFVGP